VSPSDMPPVESTTATTATGIAARAIVVDDTRCCRGVPPVFMDHLPSGMPPERGPATDDAALVFRPLLEGPR
jgi:hypothetical protein